MENNEDLIVLKKSKLKEGLFRVLTLLIDSYIKINRATTLFWRKLFSGESRIRTLLESEALVLFFNTILFCFLGVLFQGLIGKILSIVCFFNILTFLIIKMDWVNKLRKK